MNKFDWQRGKVVVVQRVIEMGEPEDFFAAFDLYGGMVGFREIIKSVPYLNALDMHFVCTFFNLKREELRCYTKKQSSLELWNSFDYPHLQDPDIIEGVRLESIPDIIAMKLSAIAQNGTRVKDFIDIATLSTKYSFDEMLGFYMAKFPNVNIIMPLKSITYFEEIDFNEPVVMMTGKFNWNRIAKRLQEMVREPKKVFTALPWA